MNSCAGDDQPDQAGVLRVRWHLASGAGHQDAYSLALKPPLRQAKICFVDTNVDAVFFPTLDFDYPALLRSCLWSLFGGPRTVALLLRPQTCLRPTKLVHLAKRFLFRLLRAAPNITILTIIPFSVEPKLARFANDWIQDPQLWDLAIIAPKALQAPQEKTEGRRTVVMLGVLNSLKGFDQFATLWINQASLRETFRFIAAGKLDPALADLAAKFVEAGGELVNERISDEQMYSYYNKADIVWCAYDPAYDQASGIFGRAFQLGIPSVVTAHSMLHKHANEMEQDVLALSPSRDGSSAVVAQQLQAWNPQRASVAEREPFVAQMRASDIHKLVANLHGKLIR